MHAGRIRKKIVYLNKHERLKPYGIDCIQKICTYTAVAELQNSSEAIITITILSFVHVRSAKLEVCGMNALKPLKVSSESRSHTVCKKSKVTNIDVPKDQVILPDPL